MRRVRTRLTAVAMAAVLSLACILSSNVIARLHHHDCTGEHCVVCHTIAGAASELSTTATVLVAGCLLLVAAGSYVARGREGRTAYGAVTPSPHPHTFACVAQTPVSLKVLLLI